MIRLLKYWLIAIQLILLISCTSPAPTSIAITEVLLETPRSSETPKATALKMEVGASYLYADGAILVAVPAGPFIMGFEERADYPEHIVNLSDFWIYSTKVTNNQYGLCVASGNCTPLLGIKNPNYDDPLRGNDPVVGVSYDQAKSYCSFANARLPTEAEWEKAARGPDGNIYPWGDAAPSCNLLNYNNCIGETTSVVKYPEGRSYYDAYDMKGNALEWVADWYQGDYYLNSPYENPVGPENGVNRVVRSSAYNSGGNQSETYHRFQSHPDTQRDNLGFRCVVEPSEIISHFAPFCEYPATYGTDGVGGEVTGEPPVEMECPNISIQQTPFCQGELPITNVKFLLTFHENPYSLTYHAPNSCNRGTSSLPITHECRGYLGSTPSNNNLTFCSYCNVTTKSEPQCPAGYEFSQQTNSCLREAPPALPPKSGTWACLPGFTLSNSGVTLTTAVPVTPDETAIASGVTGTAEETGGYCCAYTPPMYDENKVGDLRNPICEPSPNGIGLQCFPPFPVCPSGTFFDGQNCLTESHPKFCIVEPVIYKACINNGNDLDLDIDPGPGGGSCTITEQSCGNSCLPYGYIYDPDACSCDCLTG